MTERPLPLGWGLHTLTCAITRVRYCEHFDYAPRLVLVFWSHTFLWHRGYQKAVLGVMFQQVRWDWGWNLGVLCLKDPCLFIELYLQVPVLYYLFVQFFIYLGREAFPRILSHSGCWQNLGRRMQRFLIYCHKNGWNNLVGACKIFLWIFRTYLKCEKTAVTTETSNFSGLLIFF